MLIFVLTGAGISAESGLGTFRDKDGTGLWAKFDPMKLATPQAFDGDPDTVHDFYNARRENLIESKPNPAHAALARLEKALISNGDRLMLVTQNIDDLHERAGSANVIHMHGELLKARCSACQEVAEWRVPLGRSDTCPTCKITGDMRPHIVWFGEFPMFMNDIETALAASDLFVSIGTSGSVYPAAGFVSQARQLRIPTCELNLEPSDNAREFDQGYYGPASKVVDEWADRMLSETGSS